MKSIKSIFIISTLAVVFTITGCAPNISPNTYNEYSVGAVNNVVRGVIVSARPVQVNANNNGVGGLTGAAAGGIAGSAIGSGTRAGLLGAVGGAVIGGLIGNQVQKGLSNGTGIEYVIKTRSGHLISVVQGAQTPLAIGQHVMVIYGDQAKVIPDTNY